MGFTALELDLLLYETGNRYSGGPRYEHRDAQACHASVAAAFAAPNDDVSRWIGERQTKLCCRHLHLKLIAIWYADSSGVGSSLASPKPSDMALCGSPRLMSPAQAHLPVGHSYLKHTIGSRFAARFAG